MIPNRAARWASSVYLLIAAAGTYGVVADRSWPPRGEETFTALSAALMAVLATRSLRSGVLVDADGFVSRADLSTRRLRWVEVDHFESRGALVANEVGVVTVDRDWLLLQHHPYAPDYVERLEQARRAEASEADLAVAAAAAAANAGSAGKPPPGRSWRRIVLGLIVLAALVFAVVRLEVLPLGTAVVILVVVGAMRGLDAWRSRRRP